MSELEIMVTEKSRGFVDVFYPITVLIKVFVPTDYNTSYGLQLALAEKRGICGIQRD